MEDPERRYLALKSLKNSSKFANRDFKDQAVVERVRALPLPQDDPLRRAFHNLGFEGFLCQLFGKAGVEKVEFKDMKNLLMVRLGGKTFFEYTFDNKGKLDFGELKKYLCWKMISELGSSECKQFADEQFALYVAALDTVHSTKQSPSEYRPPGHSVPNSHEISFGSTVLGYQPLRQDSNISMRVLPSDTGDRPQSSTATRTSRDDSSFPRSLLAEDPPAVREQTPDRDPPARQAAEGPRTRPAAALQPPESRYPACQNFQELEELGLVQAFKKLAYRDRFGQDAVWGFRSLFGRAVSQKELSQNPFRGSFLDPGFLESLRAQLGAAGVALRVDRIGLKPGQPAGYVAVRVALKKRGHALVFEDHLAKQDMGKELCFKAAVLDSLLLHHPFLALQIIRNTFENMLEALRSAEAAPAQTGPADSLQTAAGSPISSTPVAARPDPSTLRNLANAFNHTECKFTKLIKDDEVHSLYRNIIKKLKFSNFLLQCGFMNCIKKEDPRLAPIRKIVREYPQGGERFVNETNNAIETLVKEFLREIGFRLKTSSMEEDTRIKLILVRDSDSKELKVLQVQTKEEHPEDHLKKLAKFLFFTVLLGDKALRDTLYRLWEMPS